MKLRDASLATAGRIKLVVLYPLQAESTLIIRRNFIYVNYLRLLVACLFESATNVFVLSGAWVRWQSLAVLVLSGREALRSK